MRRFVMLFFCVWFLTCSVEQAKAQALPVTITQNATGGILRQFLIKRGFAANDPRFASTFSSISSTLAGYAAGAVALVGALVTAPAWLTVGVAALGVPLAIAAGEGAATWLWNKNNPTKVTVSAPGKVPDTPPMVMGGQYAYVSYNGKVVVEGSDAQVVAGQYAGTWGNGYQLGGCSQQSSTQLYCTMYQYDSVADRWNYNAGSFNVSMYATGADHSCDHGQYWSDGYGCRVYSPVYPAGNNTPVAIQTAVNNIPGLDNAKPLNSQVMANTLNKAWQDAASKPGYAGIPFDYANPITVADVDAWAQVHPDVWPKVSDWTKPQDPINKPWTVPNTTAPVTSFDPNINNATGSNPASASQPQMNLGSDPGIPSPSLENIPTAQQILSPVLNLLPDLRNYTAPAFTGQCPKPSFEAFNKTFTLDKHCELAEQNRAAIRAGMMLVFALASVMIVLKA